MYSLAPFVVVALAVTAGIPSFHTRDARRSDPQCRPGEASRVLALLLLSVLALCITACSTRTAPVPQPVAPFEETDGRVNATQREVERTVFDAQRAGFEQRDLAGYMAAWAEDAGKQARKLSYTTVRVAMSRFARPTSPAAG